MSIRPKKETTSIKVDPELWKEVKIEAIRRDMEVSTLVGQALRREIQRPEVKAPKIKVSKIGESSS